MNHAEHRSIRVPVEWAFRVVQLMLTLLVAYAILWVRADIREEMKRELVRYVSREQFDTYQKMHGEWSEEVLKRLQDSINAVNGRLERVETKIDRISERRADAKNDPPVAGKPILR